eukprot:5254016-Amphidinium_carterae.1
MPGPRGAHDILEEQREQQSCRHPLGALRTYTAGRHGTYMKCDSCHLRWKWTNGAQVSMYVKDMNVLQRATDREMREAQQMAAARSSSEWTA